MDEELNNAGLEDKKEEPVAHHVEIYTSPTCIHCKAAKEFFQEHNVTYTEYNVVEDPSRRQEAVEKSGQMGVPVILVNDEVVIGFDEERLSELLGV
ncbi:MAG: thioredoxin family protein [Parcubacteria group bacterium]|nr:thioredoxin family protein [Parcubacteria group bacterium]